VGVDIPQPFDSHISGSLGSVGPVTVAGIPQPFAATVTGIPDTFHINIDKLPKIQLGLDPVTLHLDPVDFNVRIKEMPSTRTHLPADFAVGFSLMGMELFCIRLCGEAQMITEPYQPNPCERCGAGQTPGTGQIPGTG